MDGKEQDRVMVVRWGWDGGGVARLFGNMASQPSS